MTGVIVHEWLERHGGSENVLEQIALEFPEARIQCLWNNSGGRFDVDRVDETWIARTPLSKSKAIALPFMPVTWRTLGPADVDWILCSSHLFSHHARFAGAGKNARKYVYVHSPARYIWTPELDVRGQSIWAKAAAIPLRYIDRKRAQEAISVASNSEFVRKRVESSWRRDSEVIYPPVSVGVFSDTSLDAQLTERELKVLDSLPQTFILGASRFIPYKRLDIVIQLGQVNDIPVVLAGEGPSFPALRELAAQTPGLVTFVARPSLAMLRALYERALAYVFPAVEDFGIMPVEAMATGTPVIAPSIGGASESIIDGLTGRLLDGFSKSAMKGVVSDVERMRSEDCQARAWDFDTSVFRQTVRDWISR